MNERTPHWFTTIRRKATEVFNTHGKLEKEARKIAFDAVVAFTSAEIQTPMAEFMCRGNQNVINLAQERSGTIYRLTWNVLGSAQHISGGREVVWSWYVVTHDSQKETYVYEIVEKSTDRVPQRNGQLRLPIDQIGLSIFKPRRLEFEVGETLQVFFNIPHEYGLPLQLDKMWGGTPDMAKKSSRQKLTQSIQDTLLPVPRPI